jgi:hypothetical protein
MLYMFAHTCGKEGYGGKRERERERHTHTHTIYIYTLHIRIEDIYPNSTLP